MLTNTPTILITNTTSTAAGQYLPEPANQPKRKHSWPTFDPLTLQPLSKRICRTDSHPGLASVAHSHQPEVNRNQVVGGKGQFLELMKSLCLPVPRFVCIDIGLLAAIEEHSVKVNIMEPYITKPDLLAKLRQADAVSLATCKDWIRQLKKDQQLQCLKDLSTFIASDTFHNQVKELNIATEIRSRYDTHFPDQDRNHPVIVRSSGMNEDSFGASKAGKYASEVHGEEDIVRTCLKVMASGYQPQACSTDEPQPMALVIQECIKCQFGGVLASYSSLQDKTLLVNYAPGQAAGAVSGHNKMKPHRYDIERCESDFTARFTPGVIPYRLDLQPRDNGSGHVQKKIDNPKSDTDNVNHRLTGDALKQLYNAVTTLENRLLCPVDVEFGIDDSTGKLYLFQVRPVTRLTGDTNFSTEAPDDPLISGEVASEGVCHGHAILVNSQTDTETIVSRLPRDKKTIIITPHSDDWMITSEVLERAGGFVIYRGSSTDHIAIRLREARKPCLLAGDQFTCPEASPEQTTTLVCGNFNGSPGAYLFKDDHTATLAQHQAETVGPNYYDALLKLGNSLPSEGPDIQRPDTGFCWLNRQNTRLLDYFRNVGLFNRCLPPAHRVRLSMSPKRAEVLQLLAAEVRLLLDDAGKFVEGFGQFLRLAEAKNPDDDVFNNPSPTDLTLTPLQDRLNEITKAVESKLSKITKHLPPGQELPSPGGNFQQWLNSCQSLQTSLQTLSQPREIKNINSIHDLVFWVHKQFVSQLTPVAIGSRLGSVEKIINSLTIIDFIEEKKSGLLNDDCRNALAQNDRDVTCINMSGAVIANLNLGFHVGVIEMFEQAESGKERMLRIKLSDPGTGNKKRFWFFTRLLRAAGFDKRSAGMKIELNKALCQLTVEYNRIQTIELMQSYFSMSVKLLQGLKDFDLLPNFSLFKNEILNFSQLEKLIKKELITKASADFVFKHYLLCCAFYSERSVYDVNFIDDQYRPFTRFYPRDSLALIQQLADVQQRELSFHLFTIDAYRFKSLFNKHIYFLSCDRELIMNLLNLNGALLEHLPQWCKNDQKIVLSAVQNSGTALKFAHQSMQDDQKVVQAAFHQNHRCIEYVGPIMTGNYDFMLEVINRHGSYLKYANATLKKDKEIVLNAVKGDPEAIACAAPQLIKDITVRNAAFSKADLDGGYNKTCFVQLLKYLDQLYDGDGSLVDKEKIIKVLQDKPEYVYLFEHLPESCKKDKDIVSCAIEKNPRNFKFAHTDLKNDLDVVHLACQLFAGNIEHASKKMKAQRPLILVVVNKFGRNLKYACKKLQDDREVVLAAVNSFGAAIEYANPRFFTDEKVVLATLANWTRGDPRLLNEVVFTALANWKDCRIDALKLLDKFNAAKTGQSLSPILQTVFAQ